MRTTAAEARRGAEPAGPAPPRRAGLPDLGLTRSERDRVWAGVAGGLGERLGVDPVFVRTAFVVLAFAGGMGLVLYLLAWALAGPATQPRRPAGSRETVAFGLVVLGSLLVLRDLGLWFGDPLVWPVTLTAVGYAVIWGRSNGAERARWSRLPRIPGDPVGALFGHRIPLVRIVGGAVLVLIGLALLVRLSDAVQAAGVLFLGVLLALAGTALVLGPAITRLVRQLSDERNERIRSEERAEMAAHLHDSVLQTLALIQRSPDPREMASLARGQERELRTWLSGKTEAGSDLLSSALEDVATRIEQRHHVKVEVVVVGDGPVDPPALAVVRAAGEAMANAAQHSGAPAVSVYVEATPEEIQAYVTDEGAGFDPAAVPPDRRGIAHSVVGRMERHGGGATITSAVGEGTEVHLEITRGGP